MFFRLKEDWSLLRTEEHAAKLVQPRFSEMNGFDQKLYRCEDVSTNAPAFVFSILSGYQPPDCMINTSGYPMYSKKFIRPIAK